MRATCCSSIWPGAGSSRSPLGGRIGKKKATGTKRKKEEQPAIDIPLIPISRFEGVLTPESALSWLYNDLPGFQALLRLGIDGSSDLDVHGTSDSCLRR
jgi:hypothetical protein